MDCPTLLPEELSYCRQLEEEALLETLVECSDAHVVRFFECACEDETWAFSHQPLIQKLLTWLTKEFFWGRLLFEYAERVAKVVHAHFSLIKPLLYCDIECIVEGKHIPINSLLFGVSSDVFVSLFNRECRGKETNILELQNISVGIFELLLEYVHTGDIAFLWRRSEQEILDLVHQAVAWEVLGLGELCTSTLKRYFTEDRICSILTMAYEEGLFPLKQECFRFIEELKVGIRFFFPGELQRHLGVKIQCLRDRERSLLGPMLPLVTHLVLREGMEKDAEAVEILSRCSNLKSLDLNGTEEVAKGLVEALQDLQEIHFSSCPWLTDEALKGMLERSSNIRRVNISGNPQLTHRSWGALVRFPLLQHLDLSNCEQVDDQEVELIAVACPSLRDLNLEGCEKVTEAGVREVVRRCRDLVSLDISRCENIVEGGFLDIAAYGGELMTLKMAYCLALTEKALGEIVLRCSSLRLLDVTACRIPKPILEELKKRHPSLNILHD